MRTLQTPTDIHQHHNDHQRGVIRRVCGVRVSSERERDSQKMAGGGNDSQGEGREPQPASNRDRILPKRIVRDTGDNRAAARIGNRAAIGTFGIIPRLDGWTNRSRIGFYRKQFIWSGVLALILFVLYSAPVVLARPGPIVRHLTRVRDSRSPWFWRANLDIGIVIAAVAVIFELNGRGTLFVQRDDGLTDLSMLATSLPIVAAVAASLVALRLFRFAGGRL